MDRELVIRHLKYLARRRSTLELDLLLGRIHDRLEWTDLSTQELSAINQIFELDDIVLQKALLTKAPPPPGADPVVWDNILKLLG